MRVDGARVCARVAGVHCRSMCETAVASAVGDPAMSVVASIPTCFQLITYDCTCTPGQQSRYSACIAIAGTLGGLPGAWTGVGPAAATPYAVGDRCLPRYNPLLLPCSYPHVSTRQPVAFSCSRLNWSASVPSALSAASMLLPVVSVRKLRRRIALFIDPLSMLDDSSSVEYRCRSVPVGQFASGTLRSGCPPKTLNHGR